MGADLMYAEVRVEKWKELFEAWKKFQKNIFLLPSFSGNYLFFGVLIWIAEVFQVLHFFLTATSYPNYAPDFVKSWRIFDSLTEGGCKKILRHVPMYHWHLHDIFFKAYWFSSDLSERSILVETLRNLQVEGTLHGIWLLRPWTCDSLPKFSFLLGEEWSHDYRRIFFLVAMVDGVHLWG